MRCLARRCWAEGVVLRMSTEIYAVGTKDAVHTLFEEFG